MRKVLLAVSVLVVVGVAAYIRPIREAIEEVVHPGPHADVAFGGDMMFDRSLREYAAQYGGDYLFGCIDHVLEGVDFAVANLEGPITEHASMSVGTAPGSKDNFTFTFPTSTAALLKAHNFGAVGLGNNHIFNFGEAGVLSTIQALGQQGVGYFGDPLDHQIYETHVGGVALTFIGYNEFDSDKKMAAERAKTQVHNARAQGWVPVVLAHWGNEYETSATPAQVALAHEFVDAGAALVVGAHPHVVQNSEIYKGVPIYYSLGNFIFDQYFSPQVMRGLLLKVRFGQEAVAGVEEIPTTLTPDRKVCAL